VLSFAAPVDYVVGTQASKGLNGFAPQVITGDFHGNGKLDLVVSNKADGTVSLLAGNGDGTFQQAVTFDTGLGANNPDWMAAADFNGDGKLDLAVEGDNGEVSILMGNGNGGFAAPKLYAVGAGDRGGLAVGDYFGNGRQDIAVAIFSTNNAVAILPNNGDGTFGAVVSVALPSTFHNIRSVTTANFFGNGFADLAVAGGEGYNNTLLSTDPAGVALLKNDGKGHFTYQGEYLAAVTPDPGGGDGTGDTVNPEHVDAADLNHDGKPDLVLSLYDHNIDVFLNKGNGTFGAATAYNTETPNSVGGYPRGVAFGDFNRDGIVDIASLNFGEPVPADQSTPEPGSVGILYGNGDGTFQPAIQYTPFTLPGGLVVGDFNRDGLPDIAVTQNYSGHNVGVMINQPNTAEEPPTVTGVSPSSGPATGGTVVTIAGTNFTGTSQVDFGGVLATSFKVNSNSSITATAPAETAGVVDVTVYNAGASAAGPADKFAFTAVSAAPTVTYLYPHIGPTTGGTTVTILGTNFTSASAVTFGTLLATSFKVVSATTITAVAPPEAASVVDVTVKTPAGTSAVVTADHYTYQVPVLTTITVSPATATVLDGAKQPFAAEAFDQFGTPLATQPAFAWSVSGLGSITLTGVYTAPTSGTGSATVKAASGGVTGTAAVTVAAPLDVWTGLGKTNNWSEAANWSLSVVPDPSMTAMFNGTSGKAAVVDPAFGGAVGSVYITSIYNGAITLSRSLNVSGSYTQASGTYNANGFATTIGGTTTLYAGTYYASTAMQTLAGGLTVTGGTFGGSTGVVSTGSVTLSSGTLDAPSSYLYITGGNFAYTGGAFNADNGTVLYVGTHVSPTLSVGTGAIRFYNFTNALTAGNYPNGMTIVGTLTVTGTFAWTSSANPIYGNIEAQGNVDDENHGGIGNPYLTLDGSANQTIEDLSGQGGGQFRTITINKSGGTISLACNPIDFSGLALYAGTVSSGSHSWFVAGPLYAAPGLNLGNIAIAGPAAAVTSPSLQVANVTFASASVGLTAPSAYLMVSGNWDDSAGGVFTANGGTVFFDGTGTQTINGGGRAFNNLTIARGATLMLESDVIVVGVFTDAGTLILNGHRIIK
jgi:hypothetical protein